MSRADYAGEADLPFAQKDAYAALLVAVQGLKKMKLVTSDDQSCRVVAKGGMSAFSWGERIEVSVTEIGPGRSRISVVSQPKAGGAYDMGKNRKNAGAIVAAVAKELGAEQPALRQVSAGGEPAVFAASRKHSRQKSKSPRETQDVLLPGGNTVQVVGESHYQAELEAIAGGKTEDTCNLEKWAYLIREPENPYDRNAVAVFIDGRKVGYLSRGDAEEYGVVFDELWAKYNMRPVCLASIGGGWRRFDLDKTTVIDEGHFGVRLALVEPDGLLGHQSLTIMEPSDIAAAPPLVFDDQRREEIPQRRA